MIFENLQKKSLWCARQARALAISTLLTGALGVAGFYVLKEFDFFSTSRAELPSAKEAARLLRNPRVRFIPNKAFYSGRMCKARTREFLRDTGCIKGPVLPGRLLVAGSQNCPLIPCLSSFLAAFLKDYIHQVMRGDKEP